MAPRLRYVTLTVALQDVGRVQLEVELPVVSGPAARDGPAQRGPFAAVADARHGRRPLLHRQGVLLRNRLLRRGNGHLGRRESRDVVSRKKTIGSIHPRFIDSMHYARGPWFSVAIRCITMSRFACCSVGHYLSCGCYLGKLNCHVALWNRTMLLLSILVCCSHVPQSPFDSCARLRLLSVHGDDLLE